MNKTINHKNKNKDKYRNIPCTISRKFREAKKQWAREVCNEIEKGTKSQESGN